MTLQVVQFMRHQLWIPFLCSWKRMEYSDSPTRCAIRPGRGLGGALARREGAIVHCADSRRCHCLKHAQRGCGVSQTAESWASDCRQRIFKSYCSRARLSCSHLLNSPAQAPAPAAAPTRLLFGLLAPFDHWETRHGQRGKARWRRAASPQGVQQGGGRSPECSRQACLLVQGRRV